MFVALTLKKIVMKTVAFPMTKQVNVDVSEGLVNKYGGILNFLNEKKASHV